MAGAPVVEILRKLHAVGFLSDLSISEPDPERLSSAFDRILELFHSEIRRTREIRPVPVMLGDGQSIDLLRLYSVVRDRGGNESITARPGWPVVSQAIGFDAGRGPAVKLVYAKYLGALERWLELVLAKKQALSSAMAAAGELRAEVTGLSQEAMDPTKREEDGRQTPGSKKNHFLTSVRDGRREKGDKDKDKDSGGDDDNDDDDDDVVIIKAPEESGLGLKRKRDALVGLLDWVRRVAKNPGDEIVGRVLPSSESGKEKGSFMVGELFSQALSVRRAMFLKKTWNMDKEMPGLQVVSLVSWLLCLL